MKFDFNHIDPATGMPRIKKNNGDEINPMSIRPQRTGWIDLLQNRVMLNSIGNNRYKLTVWYDRSSQTVSSDATMEDPVLFRDATVKNGEPAKGWVYSRKQGYNYMNEGFAPEFNGDLEYETQETEISDYLKDKLYNKIMRKIGKYVKSALNDILSTDDDDADLQEDYNVLGVRVKSLTQPKMSDITDLDKQLSFEEQQTAKGVTTILQNMIKSLKFKQFLEQNGTDTIEWSHQIDTACTDGQTGRLIMNPVYAKETHDQFGDAGIQITILHEAMHNYMNNVRHAHAVQTVSDNIIADRQVNAEIVRRWPEFKETAHAMGMLF